MGSNMSSNMSGYQEQLGCMQEGVVIPPLSQ